MEGNLKETSCSWPYKFPNIRAENPSKWTEVEKRLKDPKFQAATARILGKSRAVKPCVRLALKRSFDFENSPSSPVHQPPFKKPRLADSVGTTLSESEDSSTSTCDSSCGCESPSNGLAKEYQSLCKRVLTIREKLQSVPEINSSYDQRVKELSEKARCTYDWLQNVVLPSRSHSEKSYDPQDTSDHSSKGSSEALSCCSDADSNLNLDLAQNSEKSDNSVKDEPDQTALKNFVSPPYVENVKNITLNGKQVVITLKDNPKKVLCSPFSNDSQISDVRDGNPYIKSEIRSSPSSPIKSAEMNMCSHETERLRGCRLDESCISINDNSFNNFAANPTEKSNMLVSCDNELISQTDLDESSDQETEETSSWSEVSDDTNSEYSSSSEFDYYSEPELLDTPTHSEDPEEEHPAIMSCAEEVSNSYKESQDSTLYRVSMEDNFAMSSDEEVNYSSNKSIASSDSEEHSATMSCDDDDVSNSYQEPQVPNHLRVSDEEDVILLSDDDISYTCNESRTKPPSSKGCNFDLSTDDEVSNSYQALNHSVGSKKKCNTICKSRQSMNNFEYDLSDTEPNSDNEASEYDVPKTESNSENEASESECCAVFEGRDSKSVEPLTRSIVPYNADNSPVPDIMTYVVTSIPVVSLYETDIMSHQINFKRKKNAFEKVRSRVQLCKRAIMLILKEQLCKEVEVVIPKLPDYIYEAHLQSKPIMLSNISPLISRVKSINK